MSIEILGWVACGLSQIYKFPQIYKLWKTKEGKDLSILSYSIQTVSYVCYTVYGYYTNDRPLFAMGILAGIENIGILYLCKHFKKKNEG